MVRYYCEKWSHDARPALRELELPVLALLPDAAELPDDTNYQAFLAMALVDPWTSLADLPHVTTVPMAGARLGPRWLPSVPGPIAGLLLGVAAFHTVIFIHGGPAPEAWLIGALPGLTLDSFDLPWQAVGRLPWPVIVPAAATLAVLAALDTLLTAVVADVATGDRHDARRELIGQGLGQVLAGGFGGMAAAGTTAATVVAIKSGGGRWVGVVGALVFVGLAAFAGDVGRWLPTGALAGVIIAVAFDVADTDMLSWAMQGRTRQDALIAILVTAITVLYDLMIAVGVGIVIAVALFIREQIRAPVVHRRSTAAETRSIRTHSEHERTLLEAHGDRIILYELRGTLFFGTADRLIDELGADLQGPNWLILHFRRVTRIDLTALRFIRQIATRVHEHGGCVLVCELHRGTGIHGALADAIGQVGQQAGAPPLLTFNGRDEALEFAESALLDALGTRTTQLGDIVDLGDSGLVRDLAAADIGHLESILETRDLEPGMTLFRTGDQSDELFLVARGEVEIRVSTTSHHSKRLAVYGPGSFFGELALLAPGPRAADAVVTAQTRLRILRRASFEQLKHDRPAVAIALLSAICDSLVRNQRWSTRELQRLSEW